MAKLDGTYVERKKKIEEVPKPVKKAKQQQAAAANGPSGQTPMQTGERTRGTNHSVGILP